MQTSIERITCPYCWQQIEITVDLSVEEQSLVEDCSVCCRPILVRYVSGPDGASELQAVAENE